MDCIFCKIARGEIGKLIYEDETVAAFNDASPQAPVHVLIVPKVHVTNITELADKNLAAHIFTEVVPKIAQDTGVDKTGFRLVVNTGDEGGQTVNHLHIHLLGGRKMMWPPG